MGSANVCFLSKDDVVRYSYQPMYFPGEGEVYKPRMFWPTPGNWVNTLVKAGCPEEASKGPASLLRWCDEWQLREGGASFEPLKQPRASPVPAEALSTHPPASHVCFAIKPLKRILRAFRFVQWPPTLWSTDPMCFRGTEVITLWPCHVKHLIQMVEVLQGTPNLTISHRPAY